MPVPVLTRFVKRHYGRRNFISSIFSRLIDACVDWRVAGDYRRMGPYMKPGQTVLDVGVGGGMVYRVLRDRGYDITGVDVVNLSMYPDIVPSIYDGSKLPFKNKEFDIAVLDRVLHHCGKNQENVLKEALRVAKRVMIIEDIYRNRFEKILVALNDSLGNWEWFSHHYRDYEGWRSLIKSLGGSLVHAESWIEIPQWTIYVTHGLFAVDSPRVGS